MKIKKFGDLNETFNPTKTEVKGRDYHIMSFNLDDILNDIKLINITKIDIKDLSDGDSTILKYYQYPTDGPYGKLTKVNGDNYNLVYLMNEIGYLVFKNENPVYIVGLYEPGNYHISERGLLSISGHEEVVNVWLDDGYHEMFHTR